MELKPCPFCGGKATMDQTSYGTKDGSACLGFKICCVKCHATAPRADGHVLVKLGMNGEVFTWQDDRQEACKAWNRRAETPWEQ